MHRSWMEGELMKCPWKKNNNESYEAVAVKPSFSLKENVMKFAFVFEPEGLKCFP